MKQNRKVVPFIGSCTAIVTPFDRHGRINISLFDRFSNRERYRRHSGVWDNRGVGNAHRQ